MAKLGSAMTWVKFVPIILEIIKGIRKQPATPPVDTEAREMLDDFKKDVLERLTTLEEENARLKTRVKDLRSTLDVYVAVIWVSLGVSLAALLLAILAFFRQ